MFEAFIEFSHKKYFKKFGFKLNEVENLKKLQII